MPSRPYPQPTGRATLPLPAERERGNRRCVSVPAAVRRSRERGSAPTLSPIWFPFPSALLRPGMTRLRSSSPHVITCPGLDPDTVPVIPTVIEAPRLLP